MKSRFIVAIVVAGALAAPASASAGILSPLNPVLGYAYGTYENTQSAADQTGTQYLFAFAATKTFAQTNSQQIAGTFDRGVLAGWFVEHTYDRPTDNPTWTLTGTVDPSGAAPPVPLVATFTLHYDRVEDVNNFTLDGTFAGQPIHGQSGPVVVPTLKSLTGQ